MLFSCNINTKEDKIVKKKTKIEKKEVPDFQTMVEILHKNNFCSVIDTLNQFPGQPYVILFPQMHPVPKKLSVKEEQEILL